MQLEMIAWVDSQLKYVEQLIAGDRQDEARQALEHLYDQAQDCIQVSRRTKTDTCRQGSAYQESRQASHTHTNKHTHAARVQKGNQTGARTGHCYT